MKPSFICVYLRHLRTSRFISKSAPSLRMLIARRCVGVTRSVERSYSDNDQLRSISKLRGQTEERDIYSWQSVTASHHSGYSMRLITAIVVSFFLLDATPPLYAAASSVSVSGRQLIVRKRLGDGSLAAPAPYAIRGVVWSPASDSTSTSPSDPNNVAVRRLEFSKWVATDAPLLAAMHVNTVRLVIDPGTDAS